MPSLAAVPAGVDQHVRLPDALLLLLPQVDGDAPENQDVTQQLEVGAWQR